MEMNRREFLKSFGFSVALLPLVGKVAQKKVAIKARLAKSSPNRLNSFGVPRDAIVKRFECEDDISQGSIVYMNSDGRVMGNRGDLCVGSALFDSDGGTVDVVVNPYKGGST